MGQFSIAHWLIVALVVLVLFGRGKISEMMGDFGKGISSFKKGLADDDQPRPEAPPRQIGAPPAERETARAPVDPEKPASR